MSSEKKENGIKNSVWYQQHLEKLKNKSKKNDKPEPVMAVPATLKNLPSLKSNGSEVQKKASVVKVTSASQGVKVQSVLEKSSPKVRQNVAPAAKSAPQSHGTGGLVPTVAKPQQSNSDKPLSEVRQNDTFLGKVSSKSHGTGNDATKSSFATSLAQRTYDMQTRNINAALVTKPASNSTLSSPVPGHGIKSSPHGYLASVRSSNSSATASPQTLSISRNGLDAKTFAVLEQIIANHTPKVNRNVTQTARVEKSAAYLEHLKKLKEKSSSGKSVGLPGLHTPQNVTPKSTQTQNDAYQQHLEKLRSQKMVQKNSPSRRQPPLGSGTSPQIVGVTTSSSTVKTELSDDRTLNKTQAGRRDLAAVKTETPIQGKGLTSWGRAGKAPTQNSTKVSMSKVKPIPSHATKDQKSYATCNEGIVSSQYSDDLPISDEEEFVTLDYVGEESGEDHAQNKLSPGFKRNSNPPRKELPKSEDKKPPKGILKRPHNSPQSESNMSLKSSRLDSEIRIKPNFNRVEEDAIDVISPDNRANSDLDNALAVGLEFIRPVSGYHCILCRTFYMDYPTALHHCTLLAHKMKASKNQSR